MHPAYNSRRPMVLALDFNGVIHDHVRAIDGKGPVKPDSPAIPGAIAALESYAEHFTVAVVSARFSRPGTAGTQAMVEAKTWLEARGILSHWITCDPDRSGRIILTGKKIPYQVSLDDRSIQFRGVFPDLSSLKAFKPWNVR